MANIEHPEAGAPSGVPSWENARGVTGMANVMAGPPRGASLVERTGVEEFRIGHGMVT